MFAISTHNNRIPEDDEASQSALSGLHLAALEHFVKNDISKG